MYSFVGNSPANGVDVGGLATYDLKYTNVKTHNENWYNTGSPFGGTWFAIVGGGGVSSSPSIATTNNKTTINGIGVALFTPARFYGDKPPSATWVGLDSSNYQMRGGDLMLYYQYRPSGSTCYYQLVKFETVGPYNPPTPPPVTLPPSPPKPPVLPDSVQASIGTVAPNNVLGGDGRGDTMELPAGFKDPRKNIAGQAWVLQDGNKVKFYIPVVYAGLGATATMADQFEKAAKSKWDGQKGKYEVEMVFLRGEIPGQGKIPQANLVYMDNMGDLRSNYAAHTGRLLLNLDMPWSGPHEIGHILMNGIHYDKGTDKADYPNNIMVNSRIGIVDEINIQTGIDAWKMHSAGWKPPGQ